MIYMAATGPSCEVGETAKKRGVRIAGASSSLTLKKFLGLGFGLLQTKAAASFLPFPALLEEVYTLKTLQDVALRDDLAGTLKRCMLAHFLLFLSIAGKYIISRRRFQPPFGVRRHFPFRLPGSALPSGVPEEEAGTCSRRLPLCWPCGECPAGTRRYWSAHRDP